MRFWGNHISAAQSQASLSKLQSKQAFLLKKKVVEINKYYDKIKIITRNFSTNAGKVALFL